MGTNESPPSGGALSRATKGFERVVVLALVTITMIVVALATLELGWVLVRDIASPPVFLLDADELFEIFGFVLLVLIGVELLETIKAYLRDNVVHVEIVLEVALIAIARKVIVLDVAAYEGVTVLAIAALVVALSGAFYIERRGRMRDAGPEETPPRGS